MHVLLQAPFVGRIVHVRLVGPIFCKKKNLEKKNAMSENIDMAENIECREQVYERRVDPSALAFSLSLHRHS